MDGWVYPSFCVQDLNVFIFVKWDSCYLLHCLDTQSRYLRIWYKYTLTHIFLSALAGYIPLISSSCYSCLLISSLVLTVFLISHRICHCEGDDESPLITPCHCTGSLRFVHQSCLQQWIKSSDTRCCELCKYEFIMETKLKPLRKVRRHFVLCNCLINSCPCSASVCPQWAGITPARWSLKWEKAVTVHG